LSQVGAAILESHGGSVSGDSEEPARAAKGARIRRSARSLPALSAAGCHQLSAGSGGGASGSHSPPRLREDELKQLPVNEALKHVLIRAAGSLRQAYHAMDVGKTGAVNREQFELGLARLHVRGSRIAGFGDPSALFRILDYRGRGELPLSELLGYFPVKKHQKFKDTGVMFCDYANKAAAQRSRLARAPRWRAGSGDEDDEGEYPKPWGADPDAWEQQRRDLRRRLRDLKGEMPMQGKRAMVAGLVAPENYAEMRKKERNASLIQQRRIKGAIGACSRARSDLVGLQQAMRMVAAPERHISFAERLTALGPRSPHVGPRTPVKPKVDIDVAELLAAAARRNRRGSLVVLE